MMKTRIAVLAVALSFMWGTACFAANAHVGTWKTNAAKSKQAPGMGNTNTVTYVEKKDQIQVTVDGTDKDGKATHGVWMGKTDGKAYKVKGNLSWDSMAYKMVNDHTYDITGMKGGKVTWSGRSTVAKDGKSRTLDMTGTGADGIPGLLGGGGGATWARSDAGFWTVTACPRTTGCAEPNVGANGVAGGVTQFGPASEIVCLGAGERSIHSGAASGTTRILVWVASPSGDFWANGNAVFAGSAANMPVGV